MEAAPVRIIQYFDGSKQGLIPLYQRPYSWEQRDWKTLWDDVIAQYDPEDRTSHFMGAVVTVPVKTVPVGVTKHLVIDGQQRLTTVAILLCAIRDSVSEDTPTRGIVSDYLLNRHYKSPDDLKLVPTQVDRQAFNALVKAQDLEQHTSSGIIEAYQFFCQKLSGKDANDEKLRPPQILEAIQNSLQVVMINLGENDDPYLIFESLNHKGKPLSEADLVRNYVLMRFQHSLETDGEQERVYHNLWQPMEAALGDALSEFLRHHGMQHGINVRKGEIYSAFKRTFEEHNDPAAVTDALTGMKQAAVAYERFLHPEREERLEISRWLRNLQVLDSTVFYPLLLNLLRSNQTGRLDDEGLCRCLKMLESFTVRRLVCGMPTHGLNKLTLLWCAHLPDCEQDLYLAARLAQGTGNSKFPTDDEFLMSLVFDQLYPKRKIARFVLEQLESSFGHKEVASLESATLEHILPQTLSHEWREALGSEADKLHARWINTLGNLTFTAYNTELSNRPFALKRELYQQSHYELNRWVADQTAWAEHEISRRGELLAEKAVALWPSIIPNQS